jgi:hypothetical protein
MGGKMLRVWFVYTILFACALALSFSAFAQTEGATMSGVISDPHGAVVPDVDVVATRIETGTALRTTTNKAGIYVFANLQPGHYHLEVHKPGFKAIAIKEIELNVQDKLERNFSLEIGSVSESITVRANALTVNTTDATVSTVVDRNFAENLPLNGRSFQSLIQLTPGVVLTANNGVDTGQFSVNGQRASSNYWMVDGVGANIGLNPIAPPGNGFAGALGSFSVLGGTNSVVSVDALQEFRIQTSTYAPEFGRTPGGQISILTRSGTNQFHGTLFDYLRNDVLDANDWFADQSGSRKPEERQNDFGGTFSGPILKNRTFFFFSYEGLRLRLPQVGLTTVPDLGARQTAIPALQPLLNAFPLPNGADDVANGIAQFNASFSNKAKLDAYSLRLDHGPSEILGFFGRYDYSPSELIQRGVTNSAALSQVSPTRITSQTTTVGATWAISLEMANEFRFNYSRTNSSAKAFLDNFGGAVPLPSLPVPSPFTQQDSLFSLDFFGLTNPGFEAGTLATNVQHQINVIDNFSLQKGLHSVKFGVDFRQLSPRFDPFLYGQSLVFFSVPGDASGNCGQANPSNCAVDAVGVSSNRAATFLLHNLGLFAQDTWKIRPRLTLTYGLRWDVDFAPSTSNGPSLSAVTGFNINDLSNLALAPAGTPAFQTRYASLAPRVGIAYQVSESQRWATVLRGGFGVFYDLATSEVGNLLAGNYPFSAAVSNFGVPFPPDTATVAPPPITPTTIAAFDPHLQAPYTREWNVALEQSLGGQQSISATYTGSAGGKLIQTAFLFGLNNFQSADFIANTAMSGYDALQVQFQRRLSRGLQALASYTWSHSIDDASAGSFGNGSNTLVPTINPNADRGPSDFDTRHALTAAITYEFPVPKFNPVANAVVKGWSVENELQARSAPPVDVFDASLFALRNAERSVRPDVIPGVPLYLYGSQCTVANGGVACPGGKALNFTPGAGGTCPNGLPSVGAFCDPPVVIDPILGPVPTRQGDLPRNALRAFGSFQWDFAVHRDFPIREGLKLQFRAEMFNVLNHPNFGPPISDLSNSQFGRSAQMLGRSLGGPSLGLGGFNPLYQIGGPRSIQLALKMFF